MDNRVNTIRCGLQHYWASNQVLQQLIPLEKVAKSELAISHAPTLRTIMEDFEKQSLPAGLSQKEVLCVNTLFKWWSSRVGQGSNHNLASERINQVRAAYSEIPPIIFAQINTELNKYAKETKWVLGLSVIDDDNNEELGGIGGRQRKRNLAGDEETDGIPRRKKPRSPQ